MSTTTATALPTLAELQGTGATRLNAIGPTSSSPSRACRPAGQHPRHRRRALHRPETTPAEADAAIAAAARAFPAWRVTPAPVRGAAGGLLWARCCASTRPSSAALVTIEAGKIASEALGEVQEMIDICDFAVGLSRQLYGLTIASERPGTGMMETWHPLGVVGVITAFNFPVAVWAWNAALALVCGDTVVWKPSEKTPLTALAVPGAVRARGRRRRAPRRRAPARARRRPGGRRGAGRRPAGRAGLRHRLDCAWAAPSARGVAAALRPRRCSSSAATTPPSCARPPISIWPCAASSSPPSGTAGQRCTTLRRLIVHESMVDTLVDRTAPRLRVGCRSAIPRDAGTLVGPLIDERACQRHGQPRSSEPAAEGGDGHRRRARRSRPRARGVLRRARPGADARADRRRATRDLRADPLRADATRARGGDRAQQRRPAGPVVVDLHQRPARGRTVPARPTARTAASPTSTSAPRAPRSAAHSAARRRRAAAGESGSDSWKAYMRRATNTINYGSELPLAQGVHFG